MTITVGPYTFDNVAYDEENDILFAGIQNPPPGIGEDSPEGHTFTFAEGGGDLIGLDLFGPRRLLEEKGRIDVTLPDGKTAEVQGVRSAISTLA